MLARLFGFLLLLVMQFWPNFAAASTQTQLPVTSIIVYKADRKLHLLHENKVIKTYPIGLGFTPDGHKQFEGDGKTPEGRYVIDRRNPNSAFHLSLGISYPNSADRGFAKSKGRSPGGDIFIHGQARDWKTRYFGGRDWTAGCIAMKDRHIEELFARIKTGTPITIYP